MNTPAPLDLHRVSVRVRWFMGVTWALILVKCVFVTWAVGHWHMPFNAGWVTVPTVIFAALASGLWVAHRD